MPDLSSFWPILEAVSTAAAALFAGVQIRLSRRDANARAVFDHLQEIDRRVQEAWIARPDEVQPELLAFYRRETTDLSSAASAYLSLLNALDVLAFAIQRKLVDASVVDEYISTLVNPNVVSLTFLKELQMCCNDPSVYEHLYTYFASLQQRRVTRLSR
jgi:hypothetical protein